MKSIVNIYVLLFASVLTFHSTSHAWDFGFPTTEGTGKDKKYCVKPGWFNDKPYKCIPYAEAEKLNWDTDKIYGAASGSSDVYMAAQADIDAGRARTDKLRTQLTTLNKSLAQVQEDLNSWQTPEKYAELKKRKDQIQGDIDKLQAEAGQAQISLREAQSSSQLTGAQQRVEIARKGLLAQVNELQSQLGSLEDNLNNTEQELNNSVLEAFVVSKINKLAGSLCEVQNSKMCEDPAKVKKFLMEKVASDKLRSNFKGTAPVAPAAPAAK